MTKEKEAFIKFGEDLISSIDLLTAALHYAADKIGFGADKLSGGPVTIDPVKSNTETHVVGEAMSEAEEKALKETLEVSDDDFKKALNGHARKVGKQATLALVGKYVESLNPLDINQEDRRAVMVVIEKHA